jgi:hypothetical protein
MLDAHVVVKPLRVDLIFQVNAGSASSLEDPYGIDHMSGFTVSSPAVYHERYLHCRSHSSGYSSQVFEAKNGLGYA